MLPWAKLGSDGAWLGNHWAARATRARRGIGTASEAVAAALGHGSFEMTAKRYATPGSIHTANCDRATAALFRDPSAEPN